MLKRALALLGVASALVVACGGDGVDSQFQGSSGGTSGSSGDGTSGGTSGVIGGTSGHMGTSGASGSSGSSGSSGVGPACATSSAAGKADPVYLVFVVDRSGSMKFNPVMNNKWDSVLAGLTAFFKDNQSAGLFASEQVFPQPAPSGDQCTSTNYQTPLVAMTALPDTANKLAAALTINGPDATFNTPTEAALKGAVAFAKTIEATGKKTAVVLVTDGDPMGCAGNSVASSATADSLEA